MDVISLLEIADSDLLSEIENELTILDQEFQAQEQSMMLSGPDDRADALVTFNSGQGGIEAQDWAAMLHRMISRWAERKGFDVICPDYQDGKTAGIKSSTLEIRGVNAYGLLKAFNGVHRIMRHSPFGNGERQTSFASLYVCPLKLEIKSDIVIDENKLRVDTFRSGGKGGQATNKLETAVRYTYDFIDNENMHHTVVSTCQDERSLYSNKQKAFKMLQSRVQSILDLNERNRLDEIEKGKKKATWSSQIISYSFQPYQLIKDHRSGVQLSSVDSVMDGDLDVLIEGYLLNECSK